MLRDQTRDFNSVLYSIQQLTNDSSYWSFEMKAKAEYGLEAADGAYVELDESFGLIRLIASIDADRCPAGDAQRTLIYLG